MATIVVLIFGIITVGALYVLVKAARTYEVWSGKRLVTCPETQRPAAVAVDAVHAALSGAIGQRRLRLEECSRWPERRDCGQRCLAQIELTPDDCMVRTIVTRWYEGKCCALCGTAFGHVRLSVDKPGLLASDGRTMQWSDVRVEMLPEAQAARKP